MERDDDELSAWPEHPFRRAERLGQFPQLVIHEDAQCLERAGCRVHFAGRCFRTVPMISESLRVVVIGASVRALTMARAIGRAKRSSPSG